MRDRTIFQLCEDTRKEFLEDDARIIRTWLSRNPDENDLLKLEKFRNYPPEVLEGLLEFGAYDTLKYAQITILLKLKYAALSVLGTEKKTEQEVRDFIADKFKGNL